MKADGMTEGGFRFQPLDRPALWRSLVLTMSQASALTGASERQIQHWMDRGYIRPNDPTTRKINGENLDLIVLIRQARVAGIPLRRAVAMAGEFLLAEQHAGLDGQVSSSTVDSLIEQLTTLQSGIGSLEGLLRDARPRLPVSGGDGV
jgi:DNA-binding transcriptional MerR regulator